MFPRPALTPRSPLAAPTSGQALSPRCSSRLPGLEITKHHQGFTHVHPPGLPLARLLPQTEQGPLGFYPGLRTPTDKTRRRTPEWGSILNTDRELRIRHDRPPICEFTRYARPRVARENFPYWDQDPWFGNPLVAGSSSARPTHRARTRGDPARRTPVTERHVRTLNSSAGGLVSARQYGQHSLDVVAEFLHVVA